MAGLDQAMDLLKLMDGKKAGGMSFDDVLKFASMKTMEQWMEKLNQPQLSVEDVRSIAEALGQAVSAELQSLKEEVQGEIGKRPTSFDPVIQSIASLERNIDRLVQAIGSIRLPDPPKVEIPPAKDVDLAPVLASNESIKAMIADLVSMEREDEPEPKREWSFDVKRNNSGLIRSVEVREV